MSGDAFDFGGNARDGHDPAGAGEVNSGSPDGVDGAGSVEKWNGPEAGVGGSYSVALGDILILARDWFNTHCLSQGADGWGPNGPGPAGGEAPTPGTSGARGPEVRFGGCYPVDREDVLALAQHWYKTLLGLEHDAFQTGCPDADLIWWASNRFGRIAQMVGEVEIDKIIEKVRSDLRWERGEEWWLAFTGVDKNAVARVRKESQRAGEAVSAKRSDEATIRAAHEYLKTHPTGVYFDAAGDMWYLAGVPGERSTEPGRLVLKVRTKAGYASTMPPYNVERPPGWFPPYGLR
jgi:hypothetical protein